MNRDQEPIISEIKPSADDIAMRERQLQAARKAQAARSAAAASPQRAPQASANKQTLGIVAIILVLASAGLSGFLYTQLMGLQDRLAESERIIQSQSKNLGVLNEKLSVSGENANLSLDALKVIIKEQDSEIRKLWDLSNKRNRPAITKNTKAIEQLDLSVKKTTSSVAANAKKIEDQGKRLTSTEGELTRLSEAELLLSQQAEKIREIDKAIANMKKSGLGADAAEFRLQIEDLSIRIDRLQAAMGQ